MVNEQDMFVIRVAREDLDIFDNLFVTKVAGVTRSRAKEHS